MKIRLSELTKLFEAPADTRAGLAYKRKPIQRANDFPYDRTNPDFQYGVPGNIPDRGNAGNRPDHAPGGPTPMNTAHSEWDKLAGGHEEMSGFEEASGTPMNFTISGKGGMATNVPGADGARGWAGAPTHPWDEDENQDAVEKAGKVEEGEHAFPLDVPVASIENKDPEHWADTSDQSIEHLLGRIGQKPEPEERPPEHEREPADQYSAFPSALMVMPSEPTFQTGLGRTMVPGRGFQTGWTETYDLQIPEDMVWETLARLLGIAEELS